jgi:hypothetical protein
LNEWGIRTVDGLGVCGNAETCGRAPSPQGRGFVLVARRGEALGEAIMTTRSGRCTGSAKASIF